MGMRRKLAAGAVSLSAALAFTGTAPMATATAAGQCPYSGSHPELEYDDGQNYSAAVKHAQCLWNVNNAKSGGESRLAEDGLFGWGTRSFIWRIQYACGIDTDYIIGPQTWKCLHLDESPNPKSVSGVWPVG